MRPGELEALTKACGATAGSWLLHGFQLAIETGLRRGELLGIRWRDINFGAAVLHVPFTKTDKARTIPLTDRAVEILADRKAASSTNAEYAFPVSANAFRLAWERCKRRAERDGCIGVQELRFHDLRHEAVSRFFGRGPEYSRGSINQRPQGFADAVSLYASQSRGHSCQATQE